jgi:hypothetical protein
MSDQHETSKEPTSDRPASECHIVEWPTKTVEKLGRRLYEELVHADPAPGDLEWDEMEADQKLRYWCIAQTIALTYDAAAQRPNVDL